MIDEGGGAAIDYIICWEFIESQLIYRFLLTRLRAKENEKSFQMCIDHSGIWEYMIVAKYNATGCYF